MTNLRNPFTPTFGVVPPYLAGRHGALQSMKRAFENGVGDPSLSTILIGARGSGKTALLSSIGDEALQKGWIVVNTVASQGMLEDILERTIEAAGNTLELNPKSHVTGINLGELFGIEWTRDSSQNSNWRTRMNAILEKLAETDTGLLITVDELNPQIDEMIQLTSIYQLFIREGKKVGLVMAGLPKNTTDLMDNERVSFLRRSRQQYLGPIGNADIEVAFRKTLAITGKSIQDDVMQKAVEAIGGYPYMMQLVGFYAWEEAGDSKEISLGHLERGIKLAGAELRHSVLESTYRDLSKVDRLFLMSMLSEDAPATITTVAKRMGKGANYASTYKTRLMRLGVIGERSGGSFDFDLPYFREYLEEIEQDS